MSETQALRFHQFAALCDRLFHEAGMDTTAIASRLGIPEARVLRGVTEGREARRMQNVKSHPTLSSGNAVETRFPAQNSTMKFMVSR